MKLDVPCHESLFVRQILDNNEHGEILTIFDSSTLLNQFYKRSSSKRLRNLCEKGPLDGKRKIAHPRKNHRAKNGNSENKTSLNASSMNDSGKSFKKDDATREVRSLQLEEISHTSSTSTDDLTTITVSEVSSMLSHSNPNSARSHQPKSASTSRRMESKLSKALSNTTAVTPTTPIATTSTANKFYQYLLPPESPRNHSDATEFRDSQGEDMNQEHTSTNGHYNTSCRRDNKLNTTKIKASSRPVTARRRTSAPAVKMGRPSTVNAAHLHRRRNSSSIIASDSHSSTSNNILENPSCSSSRLPQPSAEALGLLRLRRFSEQQYSQALNIFGLNMQDSEALQKSFHNRRKNYGFESKDMTKRPQNTTCGLELDQTHLHLSTLSNQSSKVVTQNSRKRHSNPNIASWQQLYSKKLSIHNLQATPLHAELKRRIRNKENAKNTSGCRRQSDTSVNFVRSSTQSSIGHRREVHVIHQPQKPYSAHLRRPSNSLQEPSRSHVSASTRESTYQASSKPWTESYHNQNEALKVREVPSLHSTSDQGNVPKMNTSPYQTSQENQMQISLSKHNTVSSSIQFNKRIEDEEKYFYDID